MNVAAAYICFISMFTRYYKIAWSAVFAFIQFGPWRVYTETKALNVWRAGLVFHCAHLFFRVARKNCSVRRAGWVRPTWLVCRCIQSADSIMMSYIKLPPADGYQPEFYKRQPFWNPDRLAYRKIYCNIIRRFPQCQCVSFLVFIICTSAQLLFATVTVAVRIL